MSRKRRGDGGQPSGRGDARVRVADEIRMRVADLLHREVRDPRLEGVHLTRVEMTKDLSLARLYWRPLPGQASIEEATAGLAAATGFLRHELAPQLDLRHAPELRFELDELPDEADRVENLLAQLRATGSAGVPGSAPESSPPPDPDRLPDEDEGDGGEDE